MLALPHRLLNSASQGSLPPTGCPSYLVPPIPLGSIPLTLFFLLSKSCPLTEQLTPKLSPFSPPLPLYQPFHSSKPRADPTPSQTCPFQPISRDNQPPFHSARPSPGPDSTLNDSRNSTPYRASPAPSTWLDPDPNASTSPAPQGTASFPPTGPTPYPGPTPSASPSPFQPVRTAFRWPLLLLAAIGTDQSLPLHPPGAAPFSNSALAWSLQIPDNRRCVIPSFTLGRSLHRPPRFRPHRGSCRAAAPLVRATPPVDSLTANPLLCARRWPYCACVRRVPAVRPSARAQARPSPNHQCCRSIGHGRRPSFPVHLP